MTRGWVWHQKGYAARPAMQSGHCSSTEKPSEDDKGFELDEKSGLFLPEAAAKDRRKVQIGFGPKAKS